MKKKLVSLASLLVLVAALIATLCGCSSYGKIEKAYLDAGWEVVSEVADAQKEMIEAVAGEDYENVCDVHVFKKNAVTYCCVLEFKSNKELEDKMGEELKGIASEDEIKETIEELDNVNGNCVYVGGLTGLEVFKSTK